MSKRTYIIVAIAIAVIIFVFFGFNIFDFNKQDTIALIGYSKYSQEWIDLKDGIESSASKHGINVEVTACDSKENVIEQIDMIEDAINNNVDAILLLPTNINLLQNILFEAEKSRIKLIIIDSYDGFEDYNYIGSNMNQVGIDMAKEFEKVEGDLSLACLYTFDDGGKSEVAYQSFRRYITENTQIDIRFFQNGIADENITATKVESIIKDSSVDYIVCFEESITRGAAMAVDAALSDESYLMPNKNVKVFGIGDINNCASYLEDDIAESIVVQNYYAIGYISVESYFDKVKDDVFTDSYIVKLSDLSDENFQKILFDIN